jgi:hypothetical protein
VQEAPAPTPTLAQSVYSIGTSKVTKDSEDNLDKEEDDAETDGGTGKNEVAINGMIFFIAMVNTGGCYL